jgi:hemolysin III
MEQQMKFSRREELANAISHFSGALFSVAALVLMLHVSSLRGNGWHVVSTAIFGTSMLVLYLSSTMTHILPMGRAKDLFFNIDRIAIYLLIAGTYTPVALVVLHGPLGWVIFGIEWGLALAGTMMILLRPGDYNTGVSTFYVISYAVMGWLILIAIAPVVRILPLMGTLWILIGGACYTLGILFFKVLKFPYHHLVWHLLVLAGSISHFFAVFYHMIPR